MAAGRRREMWEHTAALIHWIAAKFAGERVDMEALNPVEVLEAERPPADPDAEAAEGWANVRASFTAWAEQGRHAGRD
jgi:hypothetical protein